METGNLSDGRPAIVFRNEKEIKALARGMGFLFFRFMSAATMPEDREERTMVFDFMRLLETIDLPEVRKKRK